MLHGIKSIVKEVTRRNALNYQASRLLVAWMVVCFLETSLEMVDGTVHG